MATTDEHPERTWQNGFWIIMAGVLVGGLGLFFTEMPDWLKALLVVVVVALVAIGSTLLRRTPGWRPSQTLRQPDVQDE